MTKVNRKTKPVKPFSLLQRVHQASRAIAAARSEAAIGQALMDFAAFGGVHAARLLIFPSVSDGQPAAVEMREGWTLDDRPAQPYGTALLLDNYPLLEYIAADELLICENAKTDERLNEPTREIMMASGLESFAVVPLTSTVTDSWLGVVIVGRDNPSTFDKEFIYAWWTLAGQAAAALENLRLLERVEKDRQRYRDLYNRAPHCYFSIGPDGTFLEFNDTGLNWLGYERQSIIGKMRLPDILAPHSRPAFLALFPQLKAQGQISNAEVEFQRRDGTIFPVLIDATALFDKEGNFLRSRTVARDITDRRSAEAALRESETKHRLLLNSILSPILAVQDNMTILYCNQAYADFVGKAPHELEGANLLSIFPEFENTQSYPAFLEALKTGKNQTAEGVMGDRYLQASIYRTPWGILSVAQDITERQRAETEREQLLDDLGRRAIQLQTAAQVSRASSSIIDPNVLIQQAVELIRERFGLYYTGLFLIDEPGEWAVLRAGTGDAGRIQLERGHKLQVGGESMIGQCIVTAEARIALDVALADLDAYHFSNPYLPDTRSEMALPLISRGEVIGAMTIQSTQEAAFSQEDVAVLQTMADQLANAIENARLFEQRSAQTEELSVLNFVATATSQSLETQALLETVLDAVTMALDFDAGLVSLYDEGSERLYLTSQRRVPEPLVKQFEQHGLKGTLCDVVFQTGKALCIEDVFQGAPVDVRGLIQHGMRAYAGAPIMHQDKNLGTICLFKRSVYSFGADRLEQLNAVGRQIGIGIVNARLYESAQQASIEQRRQAEELRVINELGQALTATLNVDQVLQETFRGVSRLMDTTNFYIGLYDAENHQVVFRLNVTESTIDEEITAISADQGITGYIIHHQTSVLIPENVSGWLERHNIAHVGQIAACWLGAPMMVGDQVIGVMAIQDYHTPRLYDEHDRAVFVTIANQAAIATQNARLFQETQRSAQREQALRQVVAAISASKDIVSNLPDIIAPLREIVAVDTLTLTSYQPGENEFTILAVGEQVSSGHFAERGLRAPLQDTAPGWVITHKKPWVDSDIRQNQPFSADASLVAEGLVSRALLPLEIGDRVIGTLNMSSKQPGAFTSDLLPFLDQVADQFALALERARLAEEMRRMLHEVETTHRRYLQREWEGLLSAAPDRAWGYVDSPTGLTATNDYWSAEIDRAVSTGQLVATDSASGQSVDPALSIPIRLRGQTIGVLDFCDQAGDRRWTDDDKAIVEALADQIAQALETQRLFEQTQRRAFRERLTSEITGKIRAAGDMHSILETAAEELGRALGVSRARIRLDTPPDGITMSEPPADNDRNAK